MTQNDGRDVEHNIASDEVRSAHRRLLAELPSLGLTPSNNSGHVRAVRLHDAERRYLFSWIPAKRHLTFYVRKPALSLRSSLRQSLAETQLHTEETPAGEIKARIETEADARTLLGWLSRELKAMS